MLIQITGLVQLRLRPRGVQLPVCSTTVGYALWCIWETDISGLILSNGIDSLLSLTVHGDFS